MPTAPNTPQPTKNLSEPPESARQASIAGLKEQMAKLIKDLQNELEICSSSLSERYMELHSSYLKLKTEVEDIEEEALQELANIKRRTERPISAGDNVPYQEIKKLILDLIADQNLELLIDFISSTPLHIENWTPVATRLPERDTYVLVTVIRTTKRGAKTQFVAQDQYFSFEGGGWHYYANDKRYRFGDYRYEITHWAPMPYPPSTPNKKIRAVKADPSEL